MPKATKSIIINVNAPTTAPSWFTSLSTNTWGQIATVGTYEAVAPSFDLGDADSAFNDWNGLAMNQARNEFMGGALGGHTASGYQANHMTVLPLMDEVPAWIRRNDPSQAANDSSGETSGMLADGTPKTTHTYQNNVCAWDRYYQCMMGSVYSDGHGVGRIVYWDPANFTVATGTRGWTNLGTTPTDGDIYDGFASYDPLTDKIWYGQRREPTGTNKSQFGTITQSGLISRINLAVSGIGSTGSYSAGVIVYNASSSALLMFGDTRIRTLNCQNPTAITTPTFAGAVTPAGSALHGVVFNPRTNQLICPRPGTKDLLVCNVPANILTGTYTWFVYTPAGNLNSTTFVTNGTYGKFNIAHDMGNNQACLVLVHRTNEPVNVMRLSDAPLS